MVVATVVVLGDIGRSPRMQYHVSSLAEQGFDVEIVGYGETKPIKRLCDNEKISIKTLIQCPSFNKYFSKLIAYILKTLWQIITLMVCLIFKRRSDFILVQTPPAIPTLAVCWLYCTIFRTIYIIDWHNYGFTNMALTLGKHHKLVRISNWFEGFFGRRAKYNFCVTKAMKYDLQVRWNITAQVLYDRPFDSFITTSTEAKHELFKRLSEKYSLFCDDTNHENSTVFTSKLRNGLVALKQMRPALLISSTSWTDDEDFSVLLSALKDYDNCKLMTLPDLICVITGKGPLKSYYNKLIEEMKWNKVKIVTPWLEPEDYPIMLGSADLGVSLHMSTSGFDLPMKVVDMFGCNLPVAAYNFPALPELVRKGENGMVFENSTELSEQLKDWFNNFPNDQEKYNVYKNNIMSSFQGLRWHENWVLNALPYFEDNLKRITKKRT